MAKRLRIERSRYTVDGWVRMRPIYRPVPEAAYFMAERAGRSEPDSGDIYAAVNEEYGSPRGGPWHGQVVVDRVS